MTIKIEAVRYIHITPPPYNSDTREMSDLDVRSKEFFGNVGAAIAKYGHYIFNGIDNAVRNNEDSFAFLTDYCQSDEESNLEDGMLSDFALFLESIGWKKVIVTLHDYRFKITVLLK